MNAPILRHLSALRAAVGRHLAGMCEREPHLHTQRIFSAAIYGWILLNTLMLLPYYDALWGPDSLVNRKAFDPTQWDQWFIHLSAHPAFADHTYVFIVGQLACLGLVLGRTLPRLGALGVYFFTFNLWQRTGQMLDGGNNLVQLLMFYFVLMNVSGRPIRARRAAVRRSLVAVSNASFWMCRIQIVLLYLTAGILKLNGALWQKGMALYYILQGESYTHPLAREMVVAFPEIAMIATYGTLLFQILFVVLIWYRPARPYLIGAGVGLHLFGIAFGMGLFFFGLVMCLAYLAFLPGTVSARIRLPLLSREPLRVHCPPQHRRLASVLRLVARLDWRGRLHVETSADALELYTVDPVSGRQDSGLMALGRIGARIPLLLPLAPLAVAAWYVGLAQLLYARVLLAGPRIAVQ